MKIDKNEAIIFYQTLEKVQITGKDSLVVSPLLIKLDKFISAEMKKEGTKAPQEVVKNING
jgi:hypothetical protein